MRPCASPSTQPDDPCEDGWHEKQKVFWEPVWVQGHLQVVETASPYGEAAYTMTGMLVEPY